MEERIQVGNRREPVTYGNPDPKSRMAEYIASYYGIDNSDVRNIANETKVGAQRRHNLHRMMNTVFSKP